MKEIEETVNILTGDGFLKAGELDRGIELYKKEGIMVMVPQDKLIECGNVNLKKGYLYTAIESYRMAEKEIPRDKLVECGNICFLNGDLDHALEAYRMAGDKTKLIECGDDCLRRSIIARDLPKNSVIRGGVHPKSKAMEELGGVKGEIRKELHNNALEFYRAAAKISAENIS